MIPDAGPERGLTPAEPDAIQQMVPEAQDASVTPTGSDGLLRALMRTVIATALDE